MIFDVCNVSRFHIFTLEYIPKTSGGSANVSFSSHAALYGNLKIQIHGAWSQSEGGMPSGFGENLKNLCSGGVGKNVPINAMVEILFGCPRTQNACVYTSDDRTL